MIFPKNQGVPIGSLGSGKIDFFSDLTIDNITIMNNWSNPLRHIRGGFHLVDLATNTFLQGNPARDYKIKTRNKTPPGSIMADALFPEARYKITSPNFEVRIYSPFVPRDLKNSSLPAIIFDIRGGRGGVIALSFPNIVGTRRWGGRTNYRVEGGRVNGGVLMTNLRASQSDPRYGEIFIGCSGCKSKIDYEYWVPDRAEESMVEDASVFDGSSIEDGGGIRVSHKAVR